MSDDEDLFGSDSDDTAELLQAAQKKEEPSRLKKKKSSVPPKKKIVIKKKPQLEDSDSDDDRKGLFDSDDDSDEEEDKKPAAKPLSKRERLEALAKNRRGKDSPASGGVFSSERKADGKDEKGYDSGDSYDSADFQRTKEDDDFLDTTGEDAEAVQELYAEQHFDDERPDREEEGGKKKKKRRFRHDEAEEVGPDGGEPDNPIMAAVHRMKKKRKEKKSFTEMEDEVKLFLGKMELAAEDDEQAVSERRPATKKLMMLNEVVEMLTKKDMQRMLLDLDLLTVCKRWIRPLPNGTLGNVTVRQRLLEAIATMNGENGISANDLKRSEFGKVVMVLYKHKSETPSMKRLLKKLIEQWSRPIFQKSGNMRDLERVHANRGDRGLAALSRQQQQYERATQAETKMQGQQNGPDLHSVIASGKKGSAESSSVRVRVPFSKGFNYSVRPTGKASSMGSPDKRRATPGTGDTRGQLSKRMLEKGRKVTKNQRSANVSIEGRPAK